MNRPIGCKPSRRWSAALILFSLAGLSISLPARGIDDADCMVCHGDPSASATSPDGKVRSLYVNLELFQSTAHGSLSCDTCHADITETPHADKLAPVNCGACHDQAEEYAKSLHGQALARGDGDVHGCVDCHGDHAIRKSDDPLSTTARKNLPETCGKCHSDPGLARRHMLAVTKPSEAYLKSQHAHLTAVGNNEAAVCTDCHGTHDIQARQNAESSINRWRIAETCGKCHEKIRDEFKASIHGKAFAAGVQFAPNCVDCHGEHDIESPSADGSSVNKKMVSRQTCPRCHEDERVMKRFGIDAVRAASYMDSFHGLVKGAGSQVVADCTDCHGVHTILGMDDPKSTVNPANRRETCAKCHKDAGPNFGEGRVHIMPTAPGQRFLGFVRIAYLWIIAVVIGGMVLHNSLLMLRHMYDKFMEELRGTKTRRRFTRGQVVGHFILSITFTALAFSGFALRYPDAWWSLWMFPGDKGLEMRAEVHRITAVIFTALMVAALIHMIMTRNGRRETSALLLRVQDFRDALQNMGYALGLTKTRPRYDRYGYSEKFEYWGLWWGSVLMIVTGVCMWKAEWFLAFFPKYILDAAALIHFYEAILAVLTIVVWHLYHMVFDPENYPMNWSWITGKITEQDFRERHPLEYLRETENQDPEKDQGPQG